MICLMDSVLTVDRASITLGKQPKQFGDYN